MTVKVITGNIFTTKAQTIVNTVNCVGVMGAGIALECRFRYPEMYRKYIELCEQGKFEIGLLWLYKEKSRWVLNFPTKNHWRYPSKIEYLERGLEKFLSTYKDKGIISIAFPLLGADKGGIDKDDSLKVMLTYLEQVSIEVEIYRGAPLAKDDLFDATKNWLLTNDLKYIANVTGIAPRYLRTVLEALESDSICQLNQLARVEGVGVKTLEKVFSASRIAAPQTPLF